MEQGGNVFYQLVPLIFLFAIFYFLLIRPQKKQQKQHQQMIANLKKNDQVVTSGGIHGTIVAVKDKTFMVRIDEGTRVQVDKNTIAYLKKEK
jgi:preprotein translocase subunit YajC